MLASNTFVELDSALDYFLEQMIPAAFFQNGQQNKRCSGFNDGFDMFEEQFGQFFAVELNKVFLNAQ